MTKTFKELLSANNIISYLFELNKELPNTKFGYAWSKFYKNNMSKPIEEYQQDLQDLWTKYALEDKDTKALVTDKESKERGGYAFSRENKLKVLKEERELDKEWQEKDIEIKPFISEYIPEMTEYQKEILTGLII